MNKEETRRLVLDYAKGKGRQNYALSEVGEIDQMILDKIQLFTYKTKCLFSDAVAFTLTTSTATYSLRDTDVFAKPMATIEKVIINSNVLQSPWGLEPVPIRKFQISVPASDYLFRDDAEPTLWVLMAPHTLRLIAAPDQVYSNCYVQGYYLQPEIADGVEWEFPVEYHRTAACFAAAELCAPFADVPVYQMMQQMDSRAYQDMKELEGYSSALMSGKRVRGIENGTRSVRF